MSVLRVEHCDRLSVTNHKPLGNIWRLHLIQYNWGCSCQPKTLKGMIMGFPVQLLLFINQLCTGGIRGTKHGVVHSDSTWRHSSANTWSKEIIHTSKSIGWRLSSSILHHLLMQKHRYLCTEQVTGNTGHQEKLTSNPHWPSECICYEASSIKLKCSRTGHLTKSSDESRYYLARYVRHICPLLWVQGSGKVQNLPQILPHMHKMLSYAYRDWG